MDEKKIYEELTEDGHTKVWIFYQLLHTDEENDNTTERFIIDAQGCILARMICPPKGCDWTYLPWSSRKPFLPLPANAVEVDLADREGAEALIQWMSFI